MHILLVYLISRSRLYQATDVCCDFVTYCPGYTDGTWVSGVLQQTDLFSKLTQVIVPRSDWERQRKEEKTQQTSKSQKVDVWQIVNTFFFSKTYIPDAGGRTKILAEKWFSQYSLLFIITPAILKQIVTW